MDTNKNQEIPAESVTLAGKWTILGVYQPSPTKPDGDLPPDVPAGSCVRLGVDPDLKPAPEELAAIPEHLELAGMKRLPQTVQVADGVLDLETVLGTMNAGDAAYAYIPVASEKSQQVTLGFGANGWMQVWINGRQILSTMKSGNYYPVATVEDYPVDVKLDKGTNLIVVRCVSKGENVWQRGSVLAAGGPAERKEFACEREARCARAREGRDRIGPGVTKSAYIQNDGVHAWYAGGQTYTSVRGTRLLEVVMGTCAHWLEDADGNRILDFYQDWAQERISDDNGRTWNNQGDPWRFDKNNPEEQMLPTQTLYQPLLLDDSNDLLVRCFVGMTSDKEGFGNVNAGAYRAFYAISRDQGVTWSAPAQIIDRRDGYDPVHWGPGLEHGVIGGCQDGNWVWMDDGSVVVAFTTFPKGAWAGFEVVCARGYWREDKSGFDWMFGEPLVVSPDKSPQGCCEPTIANLGGDNLFIVTRCQGDPSKGIYSCRYSAFSQDGGMTWSEPEPLRYEDGSTVWSPASFARFFVSSKTGKTYLLANIIDEPVFMQEPRYPLTMAEFDRERRCIIKSSVRVIQDRPENANEHARYTNFGHYEDRETGNLVITLPEEFRYMGWDEFRRLEDCAADCVKYVVELI